MKVFLVHHYKDFEEINGLFDCIYFFNPKLEIGYLEKEMLWKKKANKKIKEANLILYMENGEPSKNVKWELQKARKHDKRIYTVNLKNELTMNGLYKDIVSYLREVGMKNFCDQSNVSKIKKEKIKQLCEGMFGKEVGFPENEEIDNLEYLRSLLNNIEELLLKGKTAGFKEKDKFIEKEKRIDQEVALFNIQYTLEEPHRANFDLFNINLDNLSDLEKTNVILEQYKTFVQSSETLMQRRQSVNSFYLTINTALITIFAALISMKVELVFLLFITSLLCLIGIATSYAWSAMLTSYGILNSSKLKVISLLERQLPVSLYDAEWKVMTSAHHDRPYKSFTATEGITVKNFFYFYICALFICLVCLVYVLVK